MTKAETAVLGKLGTEPRTVQELVDATSLGETTVRTAIKKLTEAGKVTKNGKGFITTPSTTSEPADASSTKSTKRKPPGDANRRAEAQARDAHILAVLAQHKEGLTRDELAEKAGTAKLTYMSLWRLHKAKKVRKVVGGSRQPTWIAE